MTLIWVTMGVPVFFTIPLAMKAYLCSAHEAGKTTDADFWLPLQNSGMTFAGLIVVSVPLWHCSCKGREAGPGGIGGAG